MVTALVSIVAAAAWGLANHYGVQEQEVFNDIFRSLP